MKSFSKQICKILSFSGYKSHGFYLPCSSERVAMKCPLTYKVPSNANSSTLHIKYTTNTAKIHINSVKKESLHRPSQKR